MTIYNWLSLFGVPSILLAIIWYVINRLKRNDEQTKAVQLGVQALLRDRLIQAYRIFAKQGYVDYDDRANWENMYNQYHSLGANGVMDDIRRKFLELPLDKPEE